MKKYLICLSVLSLTACVGGTSKSGDGSADTSNAPPVFSPVGEITTDGNSTAPGSSFLGGGTPSGGGGTDGGGSGGGGTGGGGGGTGGGGTGGAINLGNDNDMISDLSESEQSAICEQAFEAVTRALDGKSIDEVFCTALGVGFAADAEEDPTQVCEETARDCRSDGEIGFGCFSENDCNATIGQYEACINSALSYLSELAGYSCSDLTNVPPDDFFGGLQTPECEAFEEACGFNDSGNNATPEPEPVVTPNNFNNF